MSQTTTNPMIANFTKILEISQKMNEIQSLIPLLSYAMDMAIELIYAEFGYLVLLDEAQSFKVRIARDNKQQDLPAPESELSNTILRSTLQKQEPILSTNAEDEFSSKSAKALKLRSVICLPLFQHERPIGLLYLENRKASTLFTEESLQLVKVFAQAVSPSIYNALLNESLANEVAARVEYLDNGDSILSFFAEWMQRRFRLDAVSIQLIVKDEYTEIVSYPKPVEANAEEHFLRYQGEEIGKVIFSPCEQIRSREEEALLRRVLHQISLSSHSHILNERLKASLDELVRTVELERQRLRQDLHDDLGPQIASLMLLVDAAKNHVSNNPPAAQRSLDEIKNVAKKVVEDVRRIAQNLRPPNLDEFGFSMALTELVNRMNSPTTRISLELPENLPELHPALEATAYRIIAEALHNVLKHAQARYCRVLLLLDKKSLIIEVKDDGMGISKKAGFSIGLASMRQRAEALGGNFRIETDTGQGTKILAYLPLVNKE